MGPEVSAYNMPLSGSRPSRAGFRPAHFFLPPISKSSLCSEVVRLRTGERDVLLLLGPREMTFQFQPTWDVAPGGPLTTRFNSPESQLGFPWSPLSRQDGPSGTGNLFSDGNLGVCPDLFTRPVYHYRLRIAL